MPLAEHNRLRITNELAIAEGELRFVTSRSSGPGGQNVNKVESRVSLLFDVDSSPSLTQQQRVLIHKYLGTRLDRHGVLKIDCNTHRSQGANRREVVGRFAGLLASALRPRRSRRATRPTRASKEKRLREKARHSALKRDRSGGDE